MAGTLLAHQGGWDEMLLVLGPIAVVAGLLMLARKRVERAARAHDARIENDLNGPTPSSE